MNLKTLITFMITLIMTTSMLEGFQASFNEVAKTKNLTDIQIVLGECINENGVSVFDAVSMVKKSYSEVKKTYIGRDFELFDYCYTKMKSSDAYNKEEKRKKEVNEKRKKEYEKKRVQKQNRRYAELKELMTNKSFRPDRKTLLEDALDVFPKRGYKGVTWWFRDGVEISKNSRGETVVCHVKENGKRTGWCILDYVVESYFYNMDRIDEEDVEYIRKNFKTESKNFTIQKGPKFKGFK